MIRMCTFIAIIVGTALTITPKQGHADSCKIDNRACVLQALESSTADIKEEAWRDQTYRELAKTVAADGEIDKAISLLDKISSPDTKALTIRGIGMAVAKNAYDQKTYDTIFTKLRIAAEKIEHPPSYAIALTYIAMGQAFAEDNDGAWATAADMDNDALRHKAYGETAEIQAEKGNFPAAMKSIAFIDSEAYKNKAYGHISKILADHGKLQESYEAAESITNAYKKAQAFLYILDIQKPRDKHRE